MGGDSGESSGTGTNWRSGLGASLAAVGICGVLVLVALLGSSSQPGPLFRGDSYRHSAAPVTVSQSASQAPPANQQRRPPPKPQRNLIVLVIVLLFAGAAVALALFGLWMWWQTMRNMVSFHRKRRVRSLVLADDAEIDLLEQAGSAVARSGAELRQLLLEGEPRNAIVACWRRLEEVAADSGLERRRWETSSEFVIRILDGISGDDGATQRLGVLFREARYSDHVLPEPAREEALRLLDRVLAGLQGQRR